MTKKLKGHASRGPPTWQDAWRYTSASLPMDYEMVRPPAGQCASSHRRHCPAAGLAKGAVHGASPPRWKRGRAAVLAAAALMLALSLMLTEQLVGAELSERHAHSHNRRVRSFGSPAVGYPEPDDEGEPLEYAAAGEQEPDDEPQQQVPERLPILVSLSDNSYVSSSPILQRPLTSTTPTPPAANSSSAAGRWLRRLRHHGRQRPHGWPTTRPDETADRRLADRLQPDEPEVELEPEPADEDLDAASEQPAALRDDLQSRYDVRRATIIRTKESIRSGARFLNYTLVTGLRACLVECLISDLCDTAIYQESPASGSLSRQTPRHDDYTNFYYSTNEFGRSPAESQNDDQLFSNEIHAPLASQRHRHEPSSNSDGQRGSQESQPANRKQRTKSLATSSLLLEPDSGFFICYMFQCAPDGRLRCHFSAHNYYVSAVALPPATMRPDSDSGYPLEDQPAAGEQQQQQVRYAQLIRRQPPGAMESWHRDTPLASIRIGEENYDQYTGMGSLNSALIALIVGFAATGMLVVIVGHKMKSIRRKLAQKSTRRSLVPETTANHLFEHHEAIGNLVT